MTRDEFEAVSGVAGLASFAVAVVVGRFCTRSRRNIWALALAVAAGAMVAEIFIDGQGAFLLLAYAPVIYVLATIGRRNLDR